MVSRAPDASELPARQPVSRSALVGADLLLDLQRCVRAYPRSEASVGARQAGERMLERKMGRIEAFEREPFQRRSVDMDRKLSARNPPPRLSRRRALHCRLQSCSG